MSPDEEARRKAAAARIRAARGYAGMTQPGLAEKLGLSLATIKRIESAARPLSIEELLRIGAACHVPPDFMLHGFENMPTAHVDVIPSFVKHHGSTGIPKDCETRFTELEKRMDDFADTAARIDRALRRLFTDPSEYDEGA